MHSMTRNKALKRFSMITALAVLIAAVAYFASSPVLRASLADDQRSYRALGLLGEAFERVRSSYVEEVSDEELIEAAIQGMLAALDPHSMYSDEKHFAEMRNHTQGKFGGLGIEITLDKSGYVRVISPIDDTPAARAGIQPEDLITHINEQDIKALSLHESVKLMRGPLNSSIDLQIVRDETEILQMTLVRETINIRSVRNRLLEEKDGKDGTGEIGYIRISSFNQRTSVALREAVESLKDKSPNGINALVLDLRNNPGGLLEEAVRISDAFLERGEIVSIRGRNNDNIQRFQASLGDVTNALPIAVLINKGSASASEIVAGALQDHERATIIGTNSFGKGSVQTIIPMAGNNAALKLTTQHYYTPSGKSIAKIGLTPDVEVDSLPPIQREDGSLAPPERDVQLEKAIDVLQNLYS